MKRPKTIGFYFYDKWSNDFLLQIIEPYDCNKASQGIYSKRVLQIKKLLPKIHRMNGRIPSFKLIVGPRP